MTKERILELIASAEQNSVETECVEFKDGRGGFSGKQVWKSISSFSHRPDGGLIVYGVKENNDKTFKVVGIEDIATFQEGLINYCREDMVNCTDPGFEVVEYKGKKLLVCIVSPIADEKKPCYRKSEGMHHGACIRIKNVDKVLTADEVREFIRNSTPFKYDHLPVTGGNFNDLSLPKIKEFLKKSATKKGRDTSFLSQVGSVKHVTENVGICCSVDDVLTPTNAGYLIFSSNVPQQHKDFKRFIIRCIRYKGNTSASPIVDKIELEGSLDEQIESMQAFILKNISLSAKIVGTKRVERYEYPPDAIREIVANAVIHRDYSINETYTQVAVFENRIEISNPGNLPPGVTIENIKESQFSRNVLIANIMRDMDYMEEYGRGIEIVFATMAEYGLLGPLFKNSSNSFKVTLLGEQFKYLNDRQLKIWQILQETGKTVNAAECVDLLGNVSRPAITLDLKNMLKVGLIEKEGAGPSTRYKAKY
jgi:predicted HTH transcriptional regulator